jgi:non-ribosomal peptide synthetase component F
MNSYLRTIVATLAGLSASFVLIVGVEAFGAVVHPVPEGFGGSMEEMCRHVEQYPPWVLAAVVPMWGLAALAGTWIARRIGNLYSWGIVGLLLLLGLVFNLSKQPYPIWFKVANLLVIPAAIFAGCRFSGRRRTKSTGEVT